MNKACKSCNCRPVIILCTKCKHLKKCRVVYRCDHPCGLKQPNPDAGTFCSFGEEVENAEQTD